MLYACLACLALMAGLFAVSGAAGAAQAQDPKPQVILETSQGTITLELDRARAPITVANFLRYVDSGQYNGTIFHRVIPGFMIQGGGFTEAMQEKPTRDPIKNESGTGLSNVRGAVAMARTNDPDSATAQFFINHADNRPLDTSGGGYAVFGRVIDGMDVVDKIAAEPTAFKSGMKDVPVRPIVIQKASRKSKG